MEKKRIIIVGPAYPYRGGIADFNERLAREFQREGHEVMTYTFTLQYPSFLFPGTTQYSTSAAPEDLHIVRRVNSVNPLNWLKVGREIRRQRPDMVMIRFWLPFLAPSCALPAPLEPALSSAIPMGMLTALTTMETIAMTSPVEAVSP